MGRTERQQECINTDCIHRNTTDQLFYRFAYCILLQHSIKQYVLYSIEKTPEYVKIQSVKTDEKTQKSAIEIQYQQFNFWVQPVAKKGVRFFFLSSASSSFLFLPLLTSVWLQREEKQILINLHFFCPPPLPNTVHKVERRSF